MTDNIEQPKKAPGKPLKDIDSAAGISFLKTFMWFFSVLTLLGFFAGLMVGGLYGAFLGLVIGGVASIILSNIVMFVLDRSVENIVSLLYGGRKQAKSQGELLANDISLVKHRKMRKEFDEALKIVNRILNVDPEYPEALLLRAQILWEGFGNSSAAIKYLKQIIEKKENEQTPIHRWALSLHDELVEIEEKTLT